MMSTSDILGLAAFLLNVWGNLMLTGKSASGWYIRIVAIVCWGAYGITAASWPNVVNAITFFGINCYGLWRWKRVAPDATTLALRWYANGCPVPGRHPGDGDETGYQYDGGARARAAMGAANE